MPPIATKTMSRSSDEKGQYRTFNRQPLSATSLLHAVTANHSLPLRMLERPARGTISSRAAVEIHCTKTSMVARRG
jgi:hypothetical protein